MKLRRATPQRSKRAEVLLQAYRTYATAVRDLRSLANTREEIVLIEKHKAFSERVDLAAKAVKLAASAGMLPATSHTDLLDEDGVAAEIVSVVPRPQRVYDADKARALWPEKVLEQVVVIDSMAVRRLIEAGELEEAAAEQAEGPPKHLSPRVTIKLVEPNRRSK